MPLDSLIEAIKRTGNPTVAGLDPKLDYLPDSILKKSFSKYGETLEGAADAVLTFNRELIDALCDIVPAVKLQAAYYEMYGWQGVRALCQTIEYAKQKGMYVITDGKRNDIGSTMKAYAAAHLGVTKVAGREIPAFGAHALTVNPYLGSDGILPLIEVCREFDKGIFVLIRTSNPSSGEFQDRLTEDGEPLYIKVGEMCEEWGRQLPGKYGYSGVGAVVGATWPRQLAELRRKFPRTFFLVPGYGAQGAAADDIKGAFDKDGIGAVINSSRGIMCAWKKEGCAPEDYTGAARREALRMKEDIASVIG